MFNNIFYLNHFYIVNFLLHVCKTCSVSNVIHIKVTIITIIYYKLKTKTRTEKFVIFQLMNIQVYLHFKKPLRNMNYNYSNDNFQ